MVEWLQNNGPLAGRIRSHDWANTPLGPMEAWPDTLKTTVGLVLDSYFPQAIVWGPEMITIYNDAFLPILGNKQEALGKPFGEVWKEAWDEIRPIANAAYDGQPTFIENFPLVVERGGSPEQAYFTFCYSPVRNSVGDIVGLLDTVIETTSSVIANQRLEILNTIGSSVSNASDPLAIMETTCQKLVENLRLSNCAYADMEADGDSFTIRGDWASKGAPHITGRYSLHDFGELAVRLLNAGKPLVINDNLREIAPHEADAFQKIGIAATICMPLIKDGRLTALMAIHDNVPRTWSSHELSLLRQVADRCWAHIERARADADVRDGLAALALLNATLESRVEERSALLAETEAALRQSQKLEAIGQLTGGVAHDFNNLLTIIRSSVDFLAQPNLSSARKHRYLQAITATVERAAKLTGQLLAFARRQPLKPQGFDASERVKTIAEMLDSVTGAMVQIKVQREQSHCFVHADISQFDTALVNIALNARDAMGGEGTLVLSVRNCELPQIRGHSGSHGAFVAVSLSDSGTGIDPAVIDRIFEPFYTTKDVGKGTGLGLSQVFGFAKQSGGDVDVQSELGKGSVFTLYLPKAEQAVVECDVEVQPGVHLADNAGRRILVVEDNLEIGRFATQILQDLGFEATRAHNAAQALSMIGEEAEHFDAVFSDVMMPGDNGIVLAKELRRRRDDLPIVLTSGYSQELAEQGVGAFEFVAKPYSAQQVALALAKAMSSKPARAKILEGISAKRS
jgi:signal transduction histidine kinase/ActR/RegA family two-component response regulator